MSTPAAATRLATVTPSASATPSVAVQPVATSPQPLATPSARASATPAVHAGGVTLLEQPCSAGVARCEYLAAGTYETSGTWAFLRGLTVTLPAGWSSGEQGAGEFELHPASPSAGSGIYFWRDVVAWADGAPRPELGTTADALADYLLGDSRLIVSEGPSRIFTVRSPDNLTLAGSVQARSFSVILSDSAATEPGGFFSDCPAEACVGILTDQLHWNGGQAALTRGDLGCQPECSQAWRLYLASIGPENRPDLRSHTLVVAVSTYGTDPLQALSGWEEQVEPIIDSVLVPFIIVDN